MNKNYPRRYRIESLIQAQIVRIVPSQIDGGILTIRRVSLNRDFSVASVMYSVIGGDLTAIKALLDENKDKYRRKLATSLNMRKTPELVFVFDADGVAADDMYRFLDAVE